MIGRGQTSKRGGVAGPPKHPTTPGWGLRGGEVSHGKLLEPLIESVHHGTLER